MSRNILWRPARKPPLIEMKQRSAIRRQSRDLPWLAWTASRNQTPFWLLHFLSNAHFFPGSWAQPIASNRGTRSSLKRFRRPASVCLGPSVGINFPTSIFALSGEDHVRKFSSRPAAIELTTSSERCLAFKRGEVGSSRRFRDPTIRAVQPEKFTSQAWTSAYLEPPQAAPCRSISNERIGPHHTTDSILSLSL